MRRLILVAHSVAMPITRHRREEFKRRAIFLSKKFDTIIVSRDKDITKPIWEEDDYIKLLRIPASVRESYSCLKRVVREDDIVFCDGLGDFTPVLPIKMKMSMLKSLTVLRTLPAAMNAVYIQHLLGLEPRRGSLIEYTLMLKDKLLLTYNDKILCESLPLLVYARRLVKQKERVFLLPRSLRYVFEMPRDETWFSELVSEAASRLNIPEEDVRPIAYAASLAIFKRPDVAIRAHKHVTEHEPNAVLFMAGGGPMMNKLKQLVKRLKIEDNVVFLGWIPQYRAITLFSKSEALIHPSLVEGWSRSVCEAMAVGCPVVSYARETVSYWMGGKGVVLIHSSNPIEYAKALIRILSDDDFRLELANEAKEAMAPLVRCREEDRLQLIYKHVKSLAE